MVKYVSYWDQSNWESLVEVMNVQDREATYTAHVYFMDGSEIGTHKGTLPAHGNDRIFIKNEIEGPRREHPKRAFQGMIVIEPEHAKDEFPAMLTICDDGRTKDQQWREGNRFVPFMRVEGLPRRRTGARKKEAREAVLA